MQPGPQQPQPKQREIAVPVTKWGGMASNLPLKSVPIDHWFYLLNMDFQGPFTISSRMGTAQTMDNTTIGSKEILCHFEYKRSDAASAKQVIATSDAKLYWFDITTPNVKTLIGTLTNPTPNYVSMAMLGDNLYIADGVSAMKWDGTTFSDIKATFPVTIPAVANVIDVITTRDRIWWAESNDWLFCSVPNSPDDLAVTSLGSQKIQISYNDGMDIINMNRWGNTLIINKGNVNTGQYASYRVLGTGTSSDPFTVAPLFGDSKVPTAFIGKSAVQLGGDLIGLTLDGVTTISAINNFQESSPDNISIPIDDVIQRINFDYAHKIAATYDTVNKQYMCAVPLDGATTNNYVLILDRKVDIDTGEVANRWSLYNNWTVRCWARIKRDIYYGDETGHLIKTRVGHNDQTLGYDKVAEGGNFHFDAPDVVKMFKSIEIDIDQAGDFDINFSWTIDDFNFKTQTVPLSLDLTSTLWDVFEYDTDYYDISGNTVRTILILGRGKFIRPRFFNNTPDQSFSIGGMNYRMVKKDAGTTKN